MAQHMREDVNINVDDAAADIESAAAAVDAVADMIGGDGDINGDTVSDASNDAANDADAAEMPETPPVSDTCAGGEQQQEASGVGSELHTDSDSSVYDAQGRTDARKVIESGMREVDGIFDQYSDDIEFAKKKALDAFADIKQRSMAQLNRLGVLTDDGKLTDKYKGYANKALDVADDALGVVDGALETLQKKVREKKSDGTDTTPPSAS